LNFGGPPIRIHASIRASLSEHEVTFTQHFVKDPQQYNSCGPKVIEEMIAYVQGTEVQDETHIVPMHSALLEQELLKEAWSEKMMPAQDSLHIVPHTFESYNHVAHLGSNTVFSHGEKFSFMTPEKINLAVREKNDLTQNESEAQQAYYAAHDESLL
jgi:hypothetical protein